MQMTSEIVKKWLDYRISVYEYENRHLSLGWGKFNNATWTRDFTISACGISKDKSIQLFISQYAGKTRKEIFDTVVDMAGAEKIDEMTFLYKGYEFFVSSMMYSHDAIEFRKKYELEV